MTNRTRTTLGAILAAAGIAVVLGSTPGQGSVPVLAAAGLLASGVGTLVYGYARRLRTSAGRVGVSVLAGGLATLLLAMVLTAALRQYEMVLMTYLVIGGAGIVAVAAGIILVLAGSRMASRPDA